MSIDRKKDYTGEYNDPLEDAEFREKYIIKLLEKILIVLGGSP